MRRRGEIFWCARPCTAARRGRHFEQLLCFLGDGPILALPRRDETGVAAAGAIAGAAIVLGRRAVFDLPTVAIASVALLLITRLKARYEPLLIAGAGAIGMALSGSLH